LPDQVQKAKEIIINCSRRKKNQEKIYEKEGILAHGVEHKSVRVSACG
jgi:hypothetical protein